MPPKGGRCQGRGEGAKEGGKVPREVRHILCEKHGKCMEAMEKLKSGFRFSEVAFPVQAFPMLTATNRHSPLRSLVYYRTFSIPFVFH
uniref:Uncharacterized protein n=1 Tax=Oncorhynchus mykiss TaxID=8022 RepID=A0A8C7UNI4_ONCMY